MDILELITQIRKRYQVYTFIGFGFMIIGITLLLTLLDPVFIVFITIGFFIIIISVKNFRSKVKKIKPIIINKLLDKYFDDAVYYPNRGLTLVEVQTSELLKKPDRFYSEDYISGSVNGVKFVSSDLTLEEEQVSSNDKPSTVDYVTYFLGRFFIIDFNKNFKGKILVLEEKKSVFLSRYKKIKLESIIFNKTFNTYSTDEHSTFYVLTPHLMENLLELEAKNPGRLYISFIGNKLYIGIHNNRDTFKIGLFGSKNTSIVKGFEEDLKVIRNIILSLKLDNYIK